ncbi:hypothetical protein TURU_009179 [Turdus rufiventris]|nr:hypothetical protein TURU_009179 [Turdus rufiventris]
MEACNSKDLQKEKNSPKPEMLLQGHFNTLKTEKKDLPDQEKHEGFSWMLKESGISKLNENSRINNPVEA